MIVQQQPPLHLTYCLNIHKGESLQDICKCISLSASEVKRQLVPNQAMALGLRLSAKAAEELRTPQKREEFRQLLLDSEFYVFTINGFPYGQFHETEVKENVYAPDWRSSRRRDYTILLAEILADILPDGVNGSISTVPCSFKSWISCESDWDKMISHLVQTAAVLAEIQARRGRTIALALEPEPGCCLETTSECIDFFSDRLFPIGRIQLAEKLNIPVSEAEEHLRRHIGICLDTCHLAVNWEKPEVSLRMLQSAGISVPKIQLSSALQFEGVRENLELLERFAEPVYLHQVTESGDSGRKWLDLPEALAALRQTAGGVKVRVHFHVPLFWQGDLHLKPTAQDLNETFWKLLRSEARSHLEIETYTFDVLPPELKTQDIVKNIAAEYHWVLQRLNVA